MSPSTYRQMGHAMKTGQFLTVLVSLNALFACSGSDTGQTPNAGDVGGSQTSVETGGAGAGSPTSGGTLSTGGANATGGSLAATGGTLAGTGGAVATGGTKSATGGAPAATGGAVTTGGVKAGTGGTPAATGGAVATGGTKSATGGAPAATGGAVTTGGVNSATGGSVAPGGTTSAGGVNSATGGSVAPGGTTSAGGLGATGGAKAGTGGTSSAGGAKSTGGASSMAGATSAGGASTGCGKTPTLKNSSSSTTFTPNTVTASGTSRQYVIRWPTNYDNAHPYRLHLTLHGYGGSYSETAGSYFGLWSLSNNTTIFIALSATGGDWGTGNNLVYVDEVLKAVEADLCIDTSLVTLEGFSQGAAMSWTLACSRPGVFRAAVGHSGGGVTNPTSCKPIPYFGSGGLQESVTQTTQTDQFARWNGCTITTLPTATTGKHVCTNYTGCPAADPVRWCSYDGPHTPSPTDSGQSTSWMPQEVWGFLSAF
jgi:poly(3-hydroxybutyrate) depolymerase